MTLIRLTPLSPGIGSQLSLIMAAQPTHEERAVRREPPGVPAGSARTQEVQVDRLRSLSTALTVAEEQERNRIGQFLHDNIQQLLYGGRMAAGRLRQYLDQSEASEELTEAYNNLEEVFGEVMEAIRGLSSELNPPVLEQPSVRKILEWIAGQNQELYGLHVRIEAEDGGMLPHRELRVILIQTIRELLFNIVKHAGVDVATVRLSSDDEYINLEIEDGGKGFNQEEMRRMRQGRQGFGLDSIEERMNLIGGAMRLESSPGGGTRINLSVPRHIEGLN